MDQIKELEYRLQACQMLSQIGALQQRVAELEAREVQRAIKQAQDTATQEKFDAAVDARDMKSGAPAPGQE